MVVRFVIDQKKKSIVAFKKNPIKQEDILEKYSAP
jgi:hypothetical protein